MTSKKHAEKRSTTSEKSKATHPREDPFDKSPEEIARALAFRKIANPGSGMKMMSFYLNRAGSDQNPPRRSKLEKARALRSEKAHSGKGKPKKAA